MNDQYVPYQKNGAWYFDNRFGRQCGPYIAEEQCERALGGFFRQKPLFYPASPRTTKCADPTIFGLLIILAAIYGKYGRRREAVLKV